MRLIVLALALALVGAQPVLAETRLIGTYIWSEPWEGFGGFSAIELRPDGLGFLALSDRSVLVEGQFTRNGEAITGVAVQSHAILLDDEGNPLPAPRADSEGLALGQDNQLYISFEGVARIRVQDRGDGLPAQLPRHDDFADMQPNASLEALAVGPDGAIYTLPERSGRPLRPFPVYRFLNDAWTRPFDIPRTGPFLPTGADIGPDGLLYLLERDFTGIGFRTRIRRFALDGSGEEVLLETNTGTHGNLEGISVWQVAGGIRITLIADDNFEFFLATEIVEYRLD